MRIISGKLGGRKINPPGIMPYTRPTTDMAKEGLFNVLQHRLDFESLHTLDLFGGTGSITYELASRGAVEMTIVEKDPKMFEFIKKTINALGIDNCNVIRSDAFRFIGQTSETFDLIFAGPPYSLSEIDELPVIITEKMLLKEKGWFILEHTAKNNYENFRLFHSSRNYGGTFFSFFLNHIPLK